VSVILRGALSAAFGGGAVAALLLGGCASDRQGAGKPSPVAAAPTPSASPTKKPFEVEATVEGLDVTLTDSAGKPVLRLQAKVGTVGPSDAGAELPQGDALGALKDGRATLYQDGKPLATLTADTITADRAKRTVTGRGGVTVRSLGQEETTTVRADTITWEYDKNTLVGRGNVLLTRNPGVARVPAERFEANTALRTLTLHGSGEPATGTLPLQQGL